MNYTRFDHLSAEDTEILDLERGPIAGHTLKVVVTERPPLEDVVAALRERVAANLMYEPRCTERLFPTPLGVAPPAWVLDSAFDVSRHVRRLPAAGVVDRDGLLQMISRSMAERLDRDRPLWSLEVVERVEGGLVAYLLKVHHCMADGTGALRIASTLLWDGTGGGHPPSLHSADCGGRRPTAAQVLASGLTVRARSAVAAFLEAIKDVASPTRRRQEEREFARAPAAIRRELYPRQGPSPFDAPIGRSRAAAFVSWPLDDLKRVGHARNATVNDVLLAAVAGGLREWLIGRGTSTPEVRVKVPVSMHTGEEGPAALGNRDSFFFVDLPLAEPDPGRRLELIRSETTLCKREHDAETLYVLFNDLAHVSRHVYRRANAVVGTPGVFALAVSNVPGPADRRFLLGAPVQEIHCLAEIGDRHGLRISVISYAGTVSIGLCADATAVPDFEALTTRLEEALGELCEGRYVSPCSG